MFHHPDASAPYDDILRLFEYAKLLLDLHQDKGVEFWRNIDETALEIWIREDNADISKLLDSRAALYDLRQLLSMHLAKMRCAAEWIHRIIVENSNEHMMPDYRYSPRFGSLYHDHPELIRDCYQHADLPQAILMLLNRWYFPPLSKDSVACTQFLPHSIIKTADNDALASFLAEDWFAGDRFQVDRDLLKTIIGNASNERQILVIPRLKEWESNPLALVSASATPVIEKSRLDSRVTETFAGGLLRLPMSGSHEYLQSVRSRVAVLYLFDTYALFVEYPWNRFGSAYTRFQCFYAAAGNTSDSESQYPIEQHDRLDPLRGWFADAITELSRKRIDSLNGASKAPLKIIS
ncbi:hypothetical protein P3T18_003117 [Paraburkholderia sp. GAS199]|uniref:hypothetical protein n=1 Tax=Paraburkholderia sp. GAS199 TaxID=3035126 RepID=UPI003D252DA9